MIKKVVFSNGQALERITEKNGCLLAPDGIVNAFLPVAVNADFIKCPPNSVIAFGNNIGELRVFGEKRKRGHPDTAGTGCKPVAAIRSRPPVVFPVAPDTGYSFFKESSPYAVTLSFIKGIIQPVIHA